jgi:predicted phosphoribosyltransferase
MILSMQRFPDRAAAGRALAERLVTYANRRDVVVLALPRGGVPVGLEVARAIAAPLDVFLVRKLGAPGRAELAIGAIAPDGVRVLSAELIQELGIPPALVEQIAARERDELARRERLYRGDRPMPSLRGQVAILVDDGLATGSTMEAAVLAVRQYEPARIVVAVPVGAEETCARLAAVADEVVCVSSPEPFYAVGLWYERFEQITDEQVVAMLASRSSPCAADS